MNNLKKYIFIFVIAILCILCLIILINAIIQKDHFTLIKIISIIVGFTLYEIGDSKIIKTLRKRTKHLNFFNAITWIFSIMLIIVIFILSLISRNKLIESAFEGLYFSSISFCIRYWNIWMEADGKDSSETQ